MNKFDRMRALVGADTTPAPVPPARPVRVAWLIFVTQNGTTKGHHLAADHDEAFIKHALMAVRDVEPDAGLAAMEVDVNDRLVPNGTVMVLMPHMADVQIHHGLHPLPAEPTHHHDGTPAGKPDGTPEPGDDEDDHPEGDDEAPVNQAHRPPLREVLTTSKGDRVEVRMSDQEAADVILSLNGKNGRPWSTFAGDLAGAVRRLHLSPRQRPWLHKLANEYRFPDEVPEAPTTAADLSGVVALFDHAARHLQYPKVSFDGLDGIPFGSLRLARATDRSQHPGSVHVTDGRRRDEGGIWYGRIDRQGQFQASPRCPASVLVLLDTMAADPVAFVAEYGRQSGNCCFCHQRLTDERSVALGYGPTCAKNYGLPYGAEAARQARTGTEG